VGRLADRLFADPVQQLDTPERHDRCRIHVDVGTVTRPQQRLLDGPDSTYAVRSGACHQAAHGVVGRHLLDSDASDTRRLEGDRPLRR
jgi:hypothetical protein